MDIKEALELWEVYGDAVSLPPIYRDLGLPRLRALAAEAARSPRESAPPAPALQAQPLPLRTLRDRALSNPARLRTPGRKRASFRYHLTVSGSVAEAAARAQIPRSTLYRWRDEVPGFAAVWDWAIAQCQRKVGDDIVLQAGKAESQPVFFGGQKVGERRKVNTRLLIHVQNRMDADRRRAEDRAERRELAALRAQQAAPPIDEAALAERLVALMGQRREIQHPVSHVPESAAPDSANANKDLDKAA